MAAGVIIVADAGGSVLKVGRMDEAGAGAAERETKCTHVTGSRWIIQVHLLAVIHFAHAA